MPTSAKATASAACLPAHPLQLLPAVLPALMALFERTTLPGCLDAVSDAVEIHHQEAAMAGALAQALGAACAAAFPRLQVTWAPRWQRDDMWNSILSVGVSLPGPRSVVGEGYYARAFRTVHHCLLSKAVIRLLCV